MPDQDPTSIGVDARTPNVARIYDDLLGGKDNFAADREAAELLLEAIPDVAAVARDNRSFLGRVIRYLATEAGVRQFLDLGGGLPTQANVHELAQGVAPGAHVVYVDNDPVVASHGQALLASGDGVAVVFGDLREPDAILEHPEVRGLIDLSQPVAVLCTSTLHFIADEAGPRTFIAAYRDRLASGSYLAITHAIGGRRARGGAQAGRERLPAGVVSAARPAAGGRAGLLRRLRADRAGVQLARRMAAGAGDRAGRQTAFHARRGGPQALTPDLRPISNRRAGGGGCGLRWRSAADRCRPSGAG